MFSVCICLCTVSNYDPGGIMYLVMVIGLSGAQLQREY